MFKAIKRVMTMVPAQEAEQIIRRVFDEMIDTSEMSEHEREHLEQRRRELEEVVRRKRVA